MAVQRLDKILASQNFGSRKQVGVLIRSGRAAVNGEIVKKADFKVDTLSGKITVDGEAVSVKEHVYLMMNKPAGVLSASRDKRAQTVIDLLPRGVVRRGIFPAGRLDKDTQGLLILTDDGGFAHRMLAPKSHVEKWYEAVLCAPLSPGDTDAFEHGLRLSDMTCLPAKLQVLNEGENPTVMIKIHEGKFHEVKRMFLAVDNRVKTLKRVRIGALPLDPMLSPGETRELSQDEIADVFSNADE